MRWLTIILAFLSGAAAAQPRLTFDRQDNRIVLVGNGLIEQERLTCYLEARLMRGSLDRRMTCRNMGWSGDSVRGDARPAGFQNPAGIERLVKTAAQLKPTIIFLGYGFVESFGGDAGLSDFQQRYETLLDRLEKLTPKLVLFSPTIQEGNSQRNVDLEKYAEAIKKISAKRNLPFVDLFHPLAEFKGRHPDVLLTSNGITLNECGYWIVANEVERQLGLGGPWSVEISADRKVSAEGALVADEKSDGAIKFRLTEQSLPVTGPACEGLDNEHVSSIRVANLPAGEWTLKVDGGEVASADSDKWASGVKVALNSDRETAEKFRLAIVDCEELFYRRSRPFNDHPRHFTYIDKDYPLYDKQLVKQDELIAGLRKPVVHQVEIVPKGNAKP